MIVMITNYKVVPLFFPIKITTTNNKKFFKFNGISFGTTTKALQNLWEETQHGKKNVQPVYSCSDQLSLE